VNAAEQRLSHVINYRTNALPGEFAHMHCSHSTTVP
jgi:hypothetical protein